MNVHKPQTRLTPEQLHLLPGIVLFAVAALLMTNGNESEQFLFIGLLLAGGAFYLLVVSAVARGIKLARD